MQARLFHVAGRVILTDLAGDDLAPFELRNAAPGPAQPEPPAVCGGEERLVFRGEGWVVDRFRPVECHVDANAYRLRIGGAGRFWVATDGRSCGCSRISPEAGRKLAEHALLGPAITLALALQGTFCLHASAVEADSGAIAFAGESGAGKSTLARELADSPFHRQGRTVDDILPIELATGQATARLDFPQLKLAPAGQPALAGPPNLPLRAVFLLPPPASPKPRRSVKVERLTATDATLALVRHTVAARLFDAGLLERHLRFSAGVAERVPVRRLSYPWKPESRRRVAEAVAAELA